MKMLPIIVILLALFSCKKNPPVYPVKPYQQFEFQNLGNFGAYRMFTKTGEVSNSSLVTQYANEYAQFFYNPSAAFTGDQYKRFSFVSEDSIINTGIVPAGELKKTGTGDYDVFTSRYTIPVNDTNSLHLHLGKYKLYQLSTTPLGYSYFELADPAAILKKINDKLHLPIVRYIITSIHNNTVSFAADRFNNVFDPTGIHKLGTNDTLLIQTFDVVLRRKQ